MKTRAQRQKDQAAGAPTSPAHELPLIQPRRATKSRNPKNSPARTAIRNATRKAIERESSGETANIKNSFRDDGANNAQSSEIAAEPAIQLERDVDPLDHADSETDKSSSAPLQHNLLSEINGQKATLAATQSPHDRPVYPHGVVSPTISPSAMVVPDDEILGQGIYAPSPYSSSPLSSPPSHLSTPSQSGVSPSPVVSNAPSATGVGPQPAVARARITPSGESRKGRPAANKLQLGHDSFVSSDNSSVGATPTVDGQSPEVSPAVDDGRSPTTRVWESTPVAKLTVRDMNLLRRYGKKFPEEPYAILHLWDSPTLQDMESARPVTVPTLAMAIPKSHMSEIISSIAAKYPALVVQQTLTNTAVQTDGSPTAIKHKSTDDVEDPRPARRVRFENDESPIKPRPNKRIIGYKQAPLYTAEGKLKLCQPDVPIYAWSDSEEDDTEDGESSDDHSRAPASDSVQQQVTSYPVIETPTSSRWGIGKILESASKYVPGFRRQKPVAIPFPLTIDPPRTEPRFNTSAKTPATAQPGRRSRRTFKTYPSADRVAKPKRETARDSQRISHRNKRLQDELNAEEEKARNSRIERDFIAEQIRILNQDNAQKALAAQEEWRAEKKANPGSKRKRPPSPDVIPNPKGCSYGFDPDYFVIHDSDDESEPPSPTSERPSKSRRVDGPPPPDPLVGSRKKAQPYKGVFFKDLDDPPKYDGGNIFRESVVETASAEKAAAVRKSAVATPKKVKVKEPPRTPNGVLIRNLSGHFTVPDDSDSEEESETSEASPSSQSDKTASIAAGPEPATPAASPEKSTERQATTSEQITSSPPLKSKAQPWTQPPPPPPNPSHASLPSIASTGSESLKAARAKALQHAPRKPSGLRESSRITASPVAFNENDAVDTQGASITSQPSAEKQKTVRFALDKSASQLEQGVETQEASTSTQPPAEGQKTARSASAEAIAQLERDVANSPTPPLHEVLGVLTEKAPNGQTKVSSMVVYESNCSDANMVQSPTKASPALDKEAAPKTISSPFDASKVSPHRARSYLADFNQLQTPTKAALSSTIKPSTSPEGYYLSSGEYVSKKIQQSVDAQRTPEVVERQNNAVRLDYQAWRRRQPPSPPARVNIDIPQEELDRGANVTVNDYYGWSNHLDRPSI